MIYVSINVIVEYQSNLVYCAKLADLDELFSDEIGDLTFEWMFKAVKFNADNFIHFKVLFT